MRTLPGLATVVAASLGIAVTCASVPAQAPLELALRDGSVLAASALSGDPKTGWQVRLADGADKRIESSALLAIHSALVEAPELPTAHLAGGDVLRGVVAGGDATGNQFELQSPVLGRVTIAVDRLAMLVAAGAPPLLRLPLPDGVEEAMFVRATAGYDVLAGTLHQFGSAGVRFEPDGAAPRWYGATDFFALRLAQAQPPRQAATASLLTRSDERLGGALLAVGATGVRFGAESGEVTVRLGDIGCLVVGEGVAFASDLTPNETEESGFDGDAVWSWQRDRNALGGPLQVGGRAHAKGIGAHSRSRLTFVAPAGMATFWTRVGIDDSAGALPFTAEVDVRIEIDGKVAFERRQLRAGQPAIDSGRLPVQPGNAVTLVADFGRGRDLGDRVDWLTPVFLPAMPKRP